MSKIITLDGLRDYLTNLKRLFVTKTDAESTYETKANAANIYENKTDASKTYVTKTDAESTYETKANAANIYETKEDAATHLTKTEASETYITKVDAADTYENKTDAAKTYATKSEISEIIVHDGPEAHNAMWGGRDITAAFDSGEFSEHVADGTFKDIFPGDYITKSVTISGETYTVNWVVADCDYWINKGDSIVVTTTHHVAIVPQQSIFNARMNPTNTTEGGYAGSEMYNNVIPACAMGIVSAFGSDHILPFRDAVSNSVDASHVSSGMPQFMGTPSWFGEWASAQCNLMSEKMVYGAPIFAAGAMDNVMATRQMSAFRLSERLINDNRQSWWLRDVGSTSYFATVYGYSGVRAGVGVASFPCGVRPFALLR